VLDADKEYLYNGNVLSANDVIENGIIIDKLAQNSCKTLEFIRK
jgi:hypothetical protein